MTLQQLADKCIAMLKMLATIKLTMENPVPSGDFPLKILQWANIIGIEEGARPELNNPGNMKYAPLTASWGATKGHQASDGGWLAKFPTLKMGQNALCHFLILACEDELRSYHAIDSVTGIHQPQVRTLGGFTEIYAGHPPMGYKMAIANFLGVPLSYEISGFLK